MNKSTLKKLIAFSVVFAVMNSSFVSLVGSSPSNKPHTNLSFDTKIKILLRIINIPSAVICLIKNNSVGFLETYGYKELFKREKATKNTIYCLGSVSKAVTAVALMQLYEKGYFDLDDDVSEYLPFELKNPRYPDINITYRMILSHQAGLNDFGVKLSKVPYMLIQSRIKNNSNQLIEEMLSPGGRAYSRRYFTRYAPGEKAMYDELGFIIAGRLIEEISGLSLEEYCQKNIFQPLNMSNTSFYLDKIDKDRLARPYLTALQLNTPLPKYDFFILDAPAGLYTTAEDLSHFLIAIMNGGVYGGVRLLKEDTIQIMHTKQYPGSHDFFLGLLFRGNIEVEQGLGWFFINIFGLELQGHTGGAPGYSCHMYITKNEKNETVGIIMLANGPMLFASVMSNKLVVYGYENLLKLLVEKTTEFE